MNARIPFLLIGALIVAAQASLVCAGDTVKLESFLSSHQEVQDPPVDVGSFGLGKARIEFQEEGATIDVSLLVSIRSRADITRFHIHRGVEGENGPIVISLFDTVGDPPMDPDPIPVKHRLMRLTFYAEVDTALADEIAEFPEDFYFNVHTEEFPAGEIRGQLSHAY